MASPEPGGSTSGSTIGLSSIHINRNKPHPEQWTVPLEWSMEKRECYDVSIHSTNLFLELCLKAYESLSL